MTTKYLKRLLWLLLGRKKKLYRNLAYWWDDMSLGNVARRDRGASEGSVRAARVTHDLAINLRRRRRHHRRGFRGSLRRIVGGIIASVDDRNFRSSNLTVFERAMKMRRTRARRRRKSDEESATGRRWVAVNLFDAENFSARFATIGFFFFSFQKDKENLKLRCNFTTREERERAPIELLLWWKLLAHVPWFVADSSSLDETAIITFAIVSGTNLQQGLFSWPASKIYFWHGLFPFPRNTKWTTNFLCCVSFFMAKFHRAR